MSTAKLPSFPENKSTERTPFLNDGTNKVQFVEGKVVPGPANEPIPAVVIDVKVLESSNPMNQIGAVHTIRLKCKGWSWGQNLQEIVGAAGTLPKMAINSEVAEALFVTGKLKGREFMIEQTTKSKPSTKNPGETATWREYKGVALEKNSVL